MTQPNDEIDKALDWMLRLTTRELLFQGISDSTKVNITSDMVSKAKMEAREDIQRLIVDSKKRFIRKAIKTFPYPISDADPNWTKEYLNFLNKELQASINIEQENS